MTTADPISLAQAQRLAANADTILLRATRPADLETPIGAFLRLDDGGPAYLLESVEGGERLGRYSFLGVGPRRFSRSATASPGSRPDRSPSRPIRPICRSRRSPRPTRSTPSGRSCRAGASSRRTGCRVSPAAPSAPWRTTPSPPSRRPCRSPSGPGRRPDRRVHRDRSRAGLRPPDAHAVGDRLAAHRRAGPRGPLPDRRGRDLRGARTKRAPECG